MTSDWGLVTGSWYSDLLTSGLSEKCWKGHTIHIVPQYLSLYKIPRRFLFLCAVPSLLTPHSSLLTPNSSLDLGVELNASYLENAILVPGLENMTLVSSFRAQREIFVICGQADDVWEL